MNTNLSFEVGSTITGKQLKEKEQYFYLICNDINTKKQPIIDSPEDGIFFVCPNIVFTFPFIGFCVRIVSFSDDTEILVDYLGFRAHDLILGEPKILHDVETIKELISHGADIRPCHGIGTIFSQSSALGKLEVVRYLLENYDSSLIDVDKDRALLNAAKAGHLEIVKYLVEKGIFPYPSEYASNEVLYSAIVYQHLDVVKFVISFDKDIKTIRAGLKYARHKNDKEMAEYLESLL